MKKFTLIVFISFFYSCSEKDSIEIVLLPNDYDVVIRPFLRDSFEVFIPYKMKISNNSLKEINLSKISSSRMGSASFCLLFLEGEKKRTSSPINIPKHGSLTITAFLSLPISKSKVDSIALSKKFHQINLYKVRKEELNTYNYFKNKIKNDSIYIRFEDSKGEFFISKVGKVDSNNYCTKDLNEMNDLIYKKGNPSVFNPCNCE